MKQRNLLIRTLLLLSAIHLTISDTYGQQASNKKTNVLLIYADDYNTKSGYNKHSIVKTPNLDKLAARAVNLQRAYCQYPLCSPSRTSLLSGKRPSTTGVVDNSTPPRTKLPTTVFLPQLFRQNGYYTAQVGKIFHSSRFIKNGVPVQDYNLDSASWDLQYNELVDVKNPDIIRLAHNNPTSEGRKASNAWQILDATDEETGDGLVALKATALIRERVKEDKPFFIATGFRRPHAPYDAPRKYFDLYKNADIKVPATPADDLNDIPEIALTKRDTLTEQQIIDRIKGYYASISFMDAQVGKLLETLEKEKLWDNTIVIFMSDHGYHNGEHQGLWHKMTQFEEATHGNILITAPGLARNKQSLGLVEYVDVYPTLAELAGLKVPDDLEGKSFVPLLKKPDQAWKSAVFSEVVHQGVTGRTVRTTRHRYTEWGSPDTAELYDLEKDPNEYKNVVNDPAYSKIKEELKKTLSEGWQKVKLLSYK